MVSYKVVITTKALSQLEAYIDYIQYTLLNKQAANAVWNDAMETVNQLENVAGSLRYCDDSDLMKLGYRKINFIHHRDGCPWFIENIGLIFLTRRSYFD